MGYSKYIPGNVWPLTLTEHFTHHKESEPQRGAKGRPPSRGMLGLLTKRKSFKLKRNIYK